MRKQQGLPRKALYIKFKTIFAVAFGSNSARSLKLRANGCTQPYDAPCRGQKVLHL